MGGIVSAPPPVVQVASAPSTPSNVEDSVQTSESEGPVRRGRAGTIQTSERGVIEVKPQLAKKKTLLGE